MRLLIITQVVDRNDPVLGFFHRWIEEFAKQIESIEVVCLKEGRHKLPANVTVRSLGREGGASRATCLIRFFRYLWTLRHQYDAVFVHMNQEYVLLGGLAWRLMGKRVLLWRNHKMGSWRTRLASRFAYAVCYTSPQAYVAHMPKAVPMPVGIDISQFVPGDKPPPRGSILFLGRLDAVKNPDIFLQAMEQLADIHPEAHADIYGDPTPGREEYARELKSRFSHLKNITFHPGVPNEKTPEIYRSHAVYVNLTPSGSFDKTIGEALACGCIVIAANDAVREIIPQSHIVDSSLVTSITAGVGAGLALGSEAAVLLAKKQRAWIEKEHSLTRLVSHITNLYLELRSSWKRSGSLS